MFRPEDSDKEEDFFNAPAGTEKPKKVKQPELTPDDPRYYDAEDEWEHIRTAGRSWKMWIWLIIIGMVLGMAIAIYFIYLTPYASEEVQYGYVESIRREGHVFDTYEGVIIPYKAINDTIEPYTGDLVFSAANALLGAELVRLKKANLPVRVELETYHRAVPWRGMSRIIVVKVDTADVSKIWPVTLEHPLIPQVKKEEKE